MRHRKRKRHLRLSELIESGSPADCLRFAHRHGLITNEKVLLPPKPGLFKIFDPHLLGQMYAILDDLADIRHQRRLGRITSHQTMALAHQTSAEHIELAHWIAAMGSQGSAFLAGFKLEESKRPVAQSEPDSTLGVLVTMKLLMGNLKAVPQQSKAA
jgi:hypothetical protein